jgi:hypothetical protein
LKIEKISASTYQKPPNLYLCLAAESNHSKKITKAIIYQLMKKYKAQNTKHYDFIKQTKHLYRCQLERGHLAAVIKPYFLEAQLKLRQQE